MRTAADILSQKPPVFNVIEPGAKVIQALQLMSSVNLSYLVVMQEGVFQGIFSERDYSRNVILKGLHSDSATVREVMSVNLPAIGEQETVEHCMKLLNSHKTRYLVVFRNQDFAGVITINDVLREVIQNKHLVFDETIVQNMVNLEDRIF